MAMGSRGGPRQAELFVPTASLPETPRHVFYERLNALLAEHGFDRHLEDLCEPFYDKAGRKSIPPGVYFRMLLVGYFEGLDSQRGIAWRCADSLSLKQFLGYRLTDATPDHSSLTRIRNRLPLHVHEQVFAIVLAIVQKSLLVTGTLVGVDSTMVEANAAMKAIVRRDSGEDWKAYLKRLMIEAGEIEEDDEPGDDELRKFDRKRKSKKVSNQEWTSEVDPDARIVKMKDGRTHLGYKVEHVIDLDTEVILHAGVYHGDQSDTETLVESVIAAQTNCTTSSLHSDDPPSEISAVVADAGYFKQELLRELEAEGFQPYIAEPTYKGKPKENSPHANARQYNRIRNRGVLGRQLQRHRSERVERSFAHTCETGGARRSHLRGLDSIRKRYTIHAAARNLGTLLRQLIGVGTPRELAGAWKRMKEQLATWLKEFYATTSRHLRLPNAPSQHGRRFPYSHREKRHTLRANKPRFQIAN